MAHVSNQVASWLSQGENFLTQGDYAQAQDAFTQALSLAQQGSNPQAEVLAWQCLGQAHLSQGQPSLSVASLQQAIAIALDQHNLHALYEGHRQLAQAYKAMANFELALHHLEAADSLRETLGDRSPASSLPRLAGEPPDLATAIAIPDREALLLLFRSIVEQTNLGVAVFQEGRLVYGNPQLRQWVGYDRQDLGQVTLGDLVALAPDRDLSALGATTAGPEEGQLLNRMGQAMDVEIYARGVDIGQGQRSGLGNGLALITYLRHVGTTRQVADQLKASEARYRSLIQHVPIGLCRFDTEGWPLDANPALLGIFGCHTVDDFLQASPIQPSSPVVDQGNPMQWCDYLRQPELIKDCELKLSRADGRDLWVRVVARAVREVIPSGIASSTGTIEHYEGAVEDITEIKAAQFALEELAMRDALTHVYNRRHFLDVAHREIARSARFNHPVTLLMVDIDHFKAVNDTYGHLAGDAVLRDVALRIKTNLRQSDILARYGGEEFIVLMPETDQSQAWIGAERLRKVVAAAPFNVGSGTLSVTASVGLSCWPANHDPSIMTTLPHIDDLIHKADQALYRAKHSGRNQTQAETWLQTVTNAANSQIA